MLIRRVGSQRCSVSHFCLYDGNPVASGTNAADSPIVPISAQLSFNIDALLEYMVTHVPVPQRLFTCRPRMIVIRSFDVNKAGWEVDQLKGGVAGGSIIEGVLRVCFRLRFPQLPGSLALMLKSVRVFACFLLCSFFVFFVSFDWSLFLAIFWSFLFPCASLFCF